METKRVSRFTVNANYSCGAWSRGVSSEDKSLIILTVVLLVLFSSAGVLTTIWVDDPAFDAVIRAVGLDILPAIPYFPSQYVNLAKEIEEKSPAF